MSVDLEGKKRKPYNVSSVSDISVSSAKGKVQPGGNTEESSCCYCEFKHMPCVWFVVEYGIRGSLKCVAVTFIGS